MEEGFQSSVCISGGVLLVVFCVMALLLNGVLLIVLWKDPTKTSRSTTTVYIASLSVLHISFGIIAGTAASQSYIACAMGDEDSPHLEKEFSRICLTFFIRAENFLILAFAVERLGNFLFPDFYQRGSYKVKNALLCVGCIVFYSLCFSIFDMMAGKFWVRRLDVPLNSIVPLLATVVLTALLWNWLRKLNIPQMENNGCDGVIRETKQIPLANAFVLTVLLFVVSVVVFSVLSLYEVHCSDCWKREWFFAALRISIVINFLRAAINPFIYYVCIPHLRKGFQTLFCGRRQQEQIQLQPISGNNTQRKVPVIYL